MQLIKESFYEIKKSKFYGYLYTIDNLEEIEPLLNEVKTIHKKACHFPYAFIFNNQARKTDDKEPLGTASNPLYNFLERNKLNNHLIIVARFFGGTKLGSGGLLRAYSKTVNDLKKEE